MRAERPERASLTTIASQIRQRHDRHTETAGILGTPSGAAAALEVRQRYEMPNAGRSEPTSGRLAANVADGQAELVGRSSLQRGLLLLLLQLQQRRRRQLPAGETATGALLLRWRRHHGQLVRRSLCGRHSRLQMHAFRVHQQSVAGGEAGATMPAPVQPQVLPMDAQQMAVQQLGAEEANVTAGTGALDRRLDHRLVHGGEMMWLRRR